MDQGELAEPMLLSLSVAGQSGTLIDRMRQHLNMPPSKMKVCRGRLFSARDYVTDITEWGYADLIGTGIDEKHDAVG